MSLNQSKDVEFRIYDGDTPPNYIVGRFIQDGSTIPGMGPRPNEQLFLDRGIANVYMSRVSEDDNSIYEGIPWTLNFLLNEEFYDFIVALGNPDGVTPWTAFGTTLTPVTNIGTRINGRGVAVPCPLPADYQRNSYLVNIYARFDSPPGVSPVNPMIRELLGVAPTSLTYTVNTPVINVTMETMIFGGLDRVATFPTGTELVPAT